MYRFALPAFIVACLQAASFASAADVESIKPLPSITAEAVEGLSIKELQEKSASGDAKAQAELGARFARGAGIDIDMKTAMQLFERAAKKGEANGAYYLATAYYMGVGTKKDLSQAARWYKSAADHNHAGALLALGTMTTQGQGGLKADPKAGAVLTLRAAEQGYIPAAFQMGQLYIAGLGVEKDTEEAATWFRRILKTMPHQGAAYGLVVLIETGEAKWQPGDPGKPAKKEEAPPVFRGEPRSNTPKPASATAPAPSIERMATFKTKEGITFEARARDGYVGIFSTSQRPYSCEIKIGFTTLGASGERKAGDWTCFKTRREGGSKVLACESNHPDFVQPEIQKIDLTDCTEIQNK